MARKHARPRATLHRTLAPSGRWCWECHRPLWVAYHSHRTLVTFEGSVRYTLVVRRCNHPECKAYKQPYRPEEEGFLALPASEFGLDLVAFIGARRYQEHRSLPEIHQQLQSRGVAICERSVTNLLHRYEELVALRLADHSRLQAALKEQGRVILALDGLQPDVGHEVLWVLRDCLSGQVLLAKSLLSASEADLAALIEQVKKALPVPIAGVVSDGQVSLRNAVQKALPQVPHQLCHYHYLKEAAKPILEADRHAKKELKKAVRGARPIERSLEGRSDAEAAAAQGYCQAIRSAITDDGRAPLSAPGLKLEARLRAIFDSLERSVHAVEEKGGTRPC